MPVYNLNRVKFASELLIDCFSLSEIEDNSLSHEACQTKLHEIYFINKGFGNFKLDSETISFKEGSLLFLPPGRWRRWEKTSDDLEVYILVFKEEFISNYFHDYLFLYRFHYFYNERSPSYLHCSSAEKDEILRIILMLKKEINNLGVDSIHYLRSLLYHLLIVLNRKYKRDFNVELELLNNTQASAFKKLLEDRIKELKHVGDYAEEMGISKTQLNVITKKWFGRNAGTIIKERRIAEAKRMILYTDLNFAQISNILNYSEPSNFNRIFKSITGYTPSKFRQLYSK